MPNYRDTKLFHRQTRVGRGGKDITITKFRTMRRGAHERYTPFRNEKGFVRREKDLRVTKIGKVLRKTMIDEIPQIKNFLKGETRIFGFRPLLREDYNRLPADIKKIYDEIGPGISPVAMPYWRSGWTEKKIFDETRRFYKLWKRYGGIVGWKFVYESWLRKRKGEKVRVKK
jgi:lipopolysaccharide/colanic/teichoic acid biosynthesis glycosyltransferase